MWWVFALLSALFAALTAIFTKAGVKGVNTDLATAIRTTVVLFLAWGIAYFRNAIPGINTLTRQNLLFLCLSGIATGLSWIFYFKALQIGKVSGVVALDKLSIVIAIILSVVFFSEPFTLKTAIGCVLVVTGAIVLAL